MAEPLRMLVVDDEHEFAHALSERLQYRGALVWTAADGRQALELASMQELDAAIVDLQMPVMGGLECIARLREIRPELEIALLTGADDALARQAAQALGCSFFQKGDMPGFWDFIGRLLSR
jgi:CheY-like chemotaxis protein